MSTTIRRLRESDLDALAAMVGEHVKGHPAQEHPRDRDALRRAYLDACPVAHLFVAARGEALLGMAQWTPIFDMFWGKFGGQGEWLYVSPHARGSGIGAAIVAAICADIVAFGGDFLRFNPDNDEIGRLYKRVAMGGPPDWHYVSASALRAFAALDGLAPREIVRRLPDPALNSVD